MPSTLKQLEAEAEAGPGADGTTPRTKPISTENAGNAASTSPSASSDAVAVPEKQEKTPEEERSVGKIVVLMFSLCVSRKYSYSEI